jgi:Fe-S cluster assembly iron-binding protein IscA
MIQYNQQLLLIRNRFQQKNKHDMVFNSHDLALVIDESSVRLEKRI